MSDQNKPSDKHAQLLADIDAFARNKQNLAQSDAAQTAKPQNLPKIDPAAAGQARAQAIAAAQSTVKTPAGVSSDAAAPKSASSLLDRLKSEAQAKKSSDTQEFSLKKVQARQISESLFATFQYLRDLVEQLNVLKPAYPLGYNLMNLATFDNLSWQEGFADYRLAAGSQEERLVEKVTLRLRMADSRKIAVERESPAHEQFAKALHEANIPFETEERRNDRARTESVRFTFNCEIKSGLAFGADYTQGDIRLLLRNMQRFGSAEYRLPPDALNGDTLEQLAHLILGEPSRIERNFRRVA